MRKRLSDQLREPVTWSASWLVRIGGSAVLLCFAFAIYAAVQMYLRPPPDLHIVKASWLPGLLMSSSGTWFVSVENASGTRTYKDLVFGMDYYAESGTRMAGGSYKAYIAVRPGEKKHLVIHQGGGPEARKADIRIKRAKWK